MIDQSKLSELKALVAAFPSLAWKLDEKKVTDEAGQWVIYQIGFDGGYDKRLELIVAAITALPCLLEMADNVLKKSAEPIDAEPVDEIGKRIISAIEKHEKEYHQPKEGK